MEAVGIPPAGEESSSKASFLPPLRRKNFRQGRKKDMQNYCPQGAYHRKLLASGNVYNYIIENEGEVY